VYAWDAFFLSHFGKFVVVCDPHYPELLHVICNATNKIKVASFAVGFTVEVAPPYVISQW
jgi:hypothetical protein